VLAGSAEKNSPQYSHLLRGGSGVDSLLSLLLGGMVTKGDRLQDLIYIIVSLKQFKQLAS